MKLSFTDKLGKYKNTGYGEKVSKELLAPCYVSAWHNRAFLKHALFTHLIPSHIPKIKELFSISGRQVESGKPLLFAPLARYKARTTGKEIIIQNHLFPAPHKMFWAFFPKPVQFVETMIQPKSSALQDFTTNILFIDHLALQEHLQPTYAAMMLSDL